MLNFDLFASNFLQQIPHLEDNVVAVTSQEPKTCHHVVFSYEPMYCVRSSRNKAMYGKMMWEIEIWDNEKCQNLSRASKIAIDELIEKAVVGRHVKNVNDPQTGDYRPECSYCVDIRQVCHCPQMWSSRVIRFCDKTWKVYSKTFTLRYS